MQHSLRSFLRLRLRCPACLANRLAALWAGWQAPQCFSACLSVPGFAWLDRTDSKQASACWSVSVDGVLRDLVEGPMREFPGFSRHGTHHSALRVHLVLDVHQLRFRSRQMILYHINDQGKWRTRKVLILFNFAHRKLFRKLPMQSLDGGWAGAGLLVLAEMIAERPVAADLPAVRMDEAR